MTTKYNHSRGDRDVARKIVEDALLRNGIEDGLMVIEIAIADALYIARNDATAAVTSQFESQYAEIEKQMAVSKARMAELEARLR